MKAPAMRSPDPFRYPGRPHRRKHGPQGYRHYSEFREWLRDEFDFRCVYCLYRERWGQKKGNFDLDHLVPRKLREDLALTYDNLVYACHTCNLTKSFDLVPDPHTHAYAECLRVEDDGTITALNEAGEKLIEELDLDDQHREEFRKLVLDTVKMAARAGRADLLRQWLGLPSDLPVLERGRRNPPEGNSREDGIASSWHLKRPQPEMYE